MARQSGPSTNCLRGRVDDAIRRGPAAVEKQIRALEEWQAVILAHYPWPALVASVQRDVERLRAAFPMPGAPFPMASCGPALSR